MRSEIFARRVVAPIRLVIETNPLGRLISGDYLMPVVTAYEQHPITKDLEGIMTIFPVVRSVSPVKEAPEGVKVQALASTREAVQASIDLILYVLVFFPAMLAMLIAGSSYAYYSYSIGERSLQSPFGPIIWPLSINSL